MARFPQITSLPYNRSHPRLAELTERRVSYHSRIFLLAATTGHVARFRVKRPHATHVEQEQTSLAQGFTRKPEQVFQKLTTSGSRHPRASRKPLTLGLWGCFTGGLFLRHGKASFPGPEGSMAKLAGWGTGRGEQFLRTPTEVANGRQRVQDDRQGHFLGGRGCWLGAARLPSALRLRKKVHNDEDCEQNKDESISRVLSQEKPFLAPSVLCRCHAC